MKNFRRVREVAYNYFYYDSVAMKYYHGVRQEPPHIRDCDIRNYMKNLWTAFGNAAHIRCEHVSKVNLSGFSFTLKESPQFVLSQNIFQEIGEKLLPAFDGGAHLRQVIMALVDRHNPGE
jgi:hypothetical protein